VTVSDPILAALAAEPELLDAVRLLKTPAAVRVALWLSSVLPNEARWVPIVMRQYRRHQDRERARAARQAALTEGTEPWDGPVLVAHEFSRGKDRQGRSEVIRAALVEFRGRLRLDLRTFFQATDGSWLPTTRGIAVPLESLGELEHAVRKLGEIAKPHP